MEMFEELRPGCLDWVASIRDNSAPDSGRYRYSRHMLRPYATEATAHVVFILWMLGALDDDHDRPNIRRFLLDQQDPPTGQFKDALISDADRAGHDHSWQHIWDHHTGVVIEALALCGVAPQFPLPRQAHVDLDAVDPREWTLSLDWTHPYLVAEHWMNAVIAHHRKHGGQNTPALDTAFDTLQREIFNAQTGFPDRRVTANDDVQGLGGIFKLIFAYVPCGRPFPCPDAAVDSVLATQRPTGDFVDDNLCMNLDGMWLLRHLTNDLRRTARRREIVRASRLLADYRKSDGGFSFWPRGCLTVHNSLRVSECLPKATCSVRRTHWIALQSTRRGRQVVRPGALPTRVWGSRPADLRRGGSHFVQLQRPVAKDDGVALAVFRDGASVHV
jgi:hypothetical protein